MDTITPTPLAADPLDPAGAAESRHTETRTPVDGSSSRASAPTDPARSRSVEPYAIPEMVERVREVAVEKAHHPASMLVRSLIGGAMVAFGALLATTVSTGVSVPGLASLVMGLAFGFSFVLILVSGASLITADMAAGLVAVLDGRLRWSSYLRFLALGLVGNVLGALAFVSVAAAAGGPYLAAAFARNAATIGVAKSGAGAATSVLLAILCTWFLQTAMFLYFKARSEAARMAFAFYGPFAFVIGGTQHVIANVAFIGLPLLLRALHPAAVPASPLSWGFEAHGLLRNLLLTTAGNFVGGALLVAVPFWLAARLLRAGR